MAEEGSSSTYRSAIITFTPENFLTVGLMFVIVYLAGALVAQGLMRAGILPSQGATQAASSRPQPMPGTVAQ